MKEPQVRPAVRRGQTTSGLWPDVHAGFASTSHLRDLDLGGGPNGATTRSELIPMERVAPFIDTVSTHVNPTSSRRRQGPKATATVHTTSGVIGRYAGPRKWIYNSFPHWSLPKHDYAELKHCDLPVKNGLNKLTYGQRTTHTGIQAKTKDS